MEISSGGVRFENYKRNAYWAKVSLDTSLTRDCVEDSVDLKKQIADCIENPTRGMLAKKWAERKGVNYPEFYNRNLKVLMQDEKLKELGNVFSEKIRELYPRTWNARKFLADKEYVVLNYVKPHEWTIRKQLFKLFGR